MPFVQVSEHGAFGAVPSQPHGGVPVGDRNAAPGFVPVAHSFVEWWDPDNPAIKCQGTTKLGDPCGAARATDTELCFGHWQQVGSMVVRGLIASGT